MSAFFEDIRIGEEVALGSHRFTREEIKHFASQWDPQRFHLDEEAAHDSLFGALSASGWHTAAVWMKLLVAHNVAVANAASERGEAVARPGPSPGFRELRWLKPVYVDDVIAYSTRPVEKSDPPKHPQWGLLTAHNEGRNQSGVLVFSFTSRVLVERRIRMEPAPSLGPT